MSTTYQPEKGTEALLHVSVTKKNGIALEEPKIEHYAPEAWANVSKLPGYEAEVVHDPRNKDAKSKVSASTVKAEKPLSEASQYTERYKVLFKSEVPYELQAAPDRLKVVVDRAEATLKSLSSDEEVVNELVYEASPAGQTAPAPEFALGQTEVSPEKSESSTKPAKK